MSKALTPKQEKSCQLFVELGNKSEAYRLTYKTKTSGTALSSVAHKHFNQKKIKARVEELQAEIKEAAMYSAEDKRKLLWDIAVKCSGVRHDPDVGMMVMEDPNAARGAVAELNKMDGDLAAIQMKSENKNLNVNLNTEIDEKATAQEAADLYADMIK